MPYTAAQKAAFARRMAALRAVKAVPAVKRAYPTARAVTYTRPELVAAPAPRAAPKKKSSGGGWASAIGSTLGGIAGTALAGPAGGGVGAAIGKGLGGLFKKLTGFGDYTVNENTLLTGGMSPPEVINAVDKGGFIVRHREYIQDINATVAFTKTSLNINPGLLATFPWLSQIADGFEQYRFRGLVFEFKSMSSDAVLSSATSSALGTVIMATQYNTGQSAFGDKREMENYEFANSDKPSRSFFHPVECKMSQTVSNGLLYNRAGAVPANQDQRWYDLGTFTIATQGMQAASGVAGELWASFEIEFYKPKLNSETGLTILTDHFALSTTIDATHPLGTSSVADSSSTLGGSVTSTVYSFPSNLGTGEYLVGWTCIGNLTAALVAPVVTFNGCSGVNIYAGHTTSSFALGSGSTSTTMFYNAVVHIDSPGATLTFGVAGTFPAAITSGDLIVTQINSGVA